VRHARNGKSTDKMDMGGGSDAESWNVQDSQSGGTCVSFAPSL